MSVGVVIEHCVDVLRVHDRVDGADFGAIALGDGLGGGGDGVGDRHEFRAGSGRDGSRVDLADAASAQEPELKRHDLSLRLHPGLGARL